MATSSKLTNGNPGQKISPCLWFDSQAEEAAKFYTSLFKNSKIKTTTRYPKATEEVSGKPAGSVMTVTFEIEGQEFMALNGGPQFKFNESVSFMVNCKDQAEIDYFWNKLTADGGEESVCGWLKDKYGLSWQIIPAGWDDMAKDPAKFERTMAAILKMKKIIIEDLEEAAAAVR